MYFQKVTKEQYQKKRKAEMVSSGEKSQVQCFEDRCQERQANEYWVGLRDSCESVCQGEDLNDAIDVTVICPQLLTGFALTSCYKGGVKKKKKTGAAL